MKPIAILVAVNAALIALGFLIIPPPGERAGHGVKVGLVFDVGGKNDKSFNSAAWRGAMRAQRELGVDVEIIEPSEGADRETALRRLAAKHVDLVIGVGFIVSGTLDRLAVDFPDVKFAGIDYASSGGQIAPNLAALTFREQEGAFLVGAIAGLLTHTKVVGFIGGMKIPLIRKFEAGYEAGVAHVCKDCRVVGAYAGADPKAFADAPLGAELAAAQIAEGADILFHAAGKTGDGMFAVVHERGLRAIGVDSDQYEQLPCCLVTSMLKRVDTAVFDIAKDVIEHRFRGGYHELGLKEDGVGFVTDERNATLLPLDVVQQVRALREQIIAGKIAVPAT